MEAPNTHQRTLSRTARPNTDMDILENPKEWLKNFKQGWLAHLNETGKVDWGKYDRPRNRHAPSGPGIKLSKSRLMLISSSGGFLHDSQDPFDASNAFGDYTIRLIPSDTPFEAISYAHEHYDHQYIDKDPQVGLPLRHLEDMVSEGLIGELAPRVVSFSGYHPNVIRVVKELIPSILEVAKKDRVDAVLLVPT